MRHGRAPKHAFGRPGGPIVNRQAHNTCRIGWTRGPIKVDAVSRQQQSQLLVEGSPRRRVKTGVILQADTQRNRLSLGHPAEQKALDDPQSHSPKQHLNLTLTPSSSFFNIFLEQAIGQASDLEGVPDP